jgi:hypothetical protein
MIRIRKLKEEQDYKWIPDRDFYDYQDSDKLEFLHKKLFLIDGANAFHVEKIENAGDINRELSLRQHNADRNYIFEKVRKLNKVYKDSGYKSEFMNDAVANFSTINSILEEYKENYLAYPEEKLGILGNVMRKVSIAVVDKDVFYIKRYIEEFEVQYKYWDENIKKGMY